MRIAVTIGLSLHTVRAQSVATSGHLSTSPVVGRAHTLHGGATGARLAKQVTRVVVVGSGDGGTDAKEAGHEASLTRTVETGLGGDHLVVVLKALTLVVAA